MHVFLHQETKKMAVAGSCLFDCGATQTSKAMASGVVWCASFLNMETKMAVAARGVVFLTVGQPNKQDYGCLGLCRVRLSSPRNKDGHGCVCNILHMALANECRRSNRIIHSLLSHHGVVSPVWQLFLAKTFARKA